MLGFSLTPGNLQTSFKPRYLQNYLGYDTKILAVIVYHYALSDMWNQPNPGTPMIPLLSTLGLSYCNCQKNFVKIFEICKTQIKNQENIFSKKFSNLKWPKKCIFHAVTCNDLWYLQSLENVLLDNPKQFGLKGENVLIAKDNQK